MKERFFITATGTDIGKSFITAAMARQAKAQGLSIAAYKPLISGFDPLNPHVSDTGILLKSMGLALTPKNIERISPWRFTAPLAPSMAAQLEGASIDFDGLVGFSRYAMSGPEDLVLIEGVGGVMVPITENKTVLDWIEPLRIKTILVTGSYLGSLSHALTALTVLQQRQIAVHAIIVNESAEASVSLQQTVDELENWTDIKIVAVKRRTISYDQQPVEELGELLV